MKQSAGCLLYRQVENVWQVLIVHPSGGYNRNAPWSIPKGLVDRGETTEQTARRETMEETGVVAQTLESLGYVDLKKSRKRIHCYAGPLPDGAEAKCASWEIDQAQWHALEDARQRLHPDQGPLIDRLARLLDGTT